jgi:hypothetical protein
MAGRNSLAALLCAVLCIGVGVPAFGQSETGDVDSQRGPAGPSTALTSAVLAGIGGFLPNERCCLADGNCIMVSVVTCITIGGNPGGSGTACADGPCDPFIGCCFPDLSCEKIDPATCAALGGDSLGAGSTCFQNTACRITGACCLPDGNCVNQIRLTDCNNLGGMFTPAEAEWALYQGFNPVALSDACATTVCTGACWFDPDGSGTPGTCMNDMTAVACLSMGGVYQGHGSVQCAVDPECGREVQERRFQFTQGGAGTVVSFRKFDDQGGSRQLKSAVLSIDGEVIHRIIILNISGTSKENKPVDLATDVLIDDSVVRGAIAGANVPQNPLIDEALLFVCEGVGTLGPGEFCDYGGNIRFPAPGELYVVPGADLPLFVGAGETLSAAFIGESQFSFTSLFFDVGNPTNQFQGELRVVYEYAFTGACCHPCDGVCTPNLTRDECEAGGGIYQGDLTDCTKGLCPILGACCHPCDGTCTANVTEAVCSASGGIWQGPCSECTPGLCPIIGACCHPCDGTCTSDVTEAVCSASGGIWQGPCSECTPGLCPVLGACCHPCDGTCTADITQAACLASGGIWQGICSTCSPNPCVPIGACCHPCNGVCVPDVTQAECVALAGGTFPGEIGIWRGPCSDCTIPCPIVGACCLPDGDCERLTIAECDDAGGSFKGLCTDCSTVRCEGACCLCDGSCIDAQTRDECEAHPDGGIWQGLDTECATIECPEVRACCLPTPDGQCVDLIEECCIAQGGIWQGPGTNCASIVCLPVCQKGCTHKGSLIIYSKIEIRWTAAGDLLQDTFISLTNDHPDDVLVQFFFINGDMPLPATDGERAHPGWNFLDNRILLTGNQPVWWSAATGDGYGVSPFTVLDPGTPPGRPAMDGTDDRVLRGWIVGWAVNYKGEEIRWNHLSGTGTLVYYGSGGAAWEYIACAITSASEGIPNGGVLPNPGVLNLDGAEYCELPSHLLLNFQAVQSSAWSTPTAQVNSDTDLTLHPVDADLRLNVVTDGPPATWAKFDVWNEMEVKFSGMGRCITCWDQTLLRFYGSPNHALLNMLQTNHGKARIEGTAHPACPNSVPRALLGVYARWLTFSRPSGFDDGLAAAGGNLIWMGSRSATIQHDAVADFPPEMPVILEPSRNPFEAADDLIDELLNAPRKSVTSASAANSAGR